MDGFGGFHTELVQVPGVIPATPSQPPLSPYAKAAVELRRIEEVEALVLTKRRPGFDRASVAAASDAVLTAAEAPRLKFLVFDFAHRGDLAAAPAAGIEDLLSEVSSLILRAGVITVAVAHDLMGGSDLELALACNVLVGGPRATFSFDADPLASVRTYALLAQKIGFVRAERLMENGDVLGPAQMQTLLLLKETFASDDDPDQVTAFLHRYLRRHNAACGIYRAQRIASPFPLEHLKGSAVHA
jgi:enoyl-CoA hydratase/carnithine racemase